MTTLIRLLIQVVLCGLTNGVYDGQVYPSDNPVSILQLNSKRPPSNTLNEVVSTKKSHKVRHGHGTDRKKNCCKNGGICILGSFCQCPNEYHGRYCEMKVRGKDCASGIPHGAWFRSDCDLCHCFEGEFSCIPEIFPGCDESEYLDTTKEINPLQGEDIEILKTNGHIEGLSLNSEDSEYLDGYYYDDNGQSSVARCKSWTGLFLWTVTITVMLICR